jgi:hypothetical protein
VLNTMLRMFTLVLVTLASAGYAVAAEAAATPAPTAPSPTTPAPSCAYEYKPFPRLQATPVQEDLFVSRLRDACEALETAPALKPVNTCKVASAAPAGPPADSIAEQIRLARKLPLASEEEAAPTPAPGAAAKPAKGKDATEIETEATESPEECASAFTNMQAVISYEQSLKAVCAKLRRAAPQKVDETDLGVLRQARDGSEILTAITLWKDEKFEGFRRFQKSLRSADGAGASFAGALAPGLGTLSDQLIRGMAEFLAKRAQDEALRYLREKLKESLCGDAGAHADLRKAAFSYTCQAIQNLDESMSLQAIGSTMRAAAEKDLRKLPDLGLHYAETVHPQAANLTFAARLGLAYFEAVRRGQEPFGVLCSLGELEPQSCEAKDCAPVSQAVRMASAFAYALRQGGSGWDGFYNPKKLVPQDRAVAGVALLLLMERRLEQLAAPQLPAWKLTATLVNAVIVRTLDLVTGALDLVRTWEALQATLGGDLSEDQRRQLLAEGMAASAEKVAHFVQLLDRFHFIDSSPKVTEAMEYWSDFVEVAAGLVRRDYAGAVTTTLSALGKVAEKDAFPASGGGKYLPLIVEIASAQSSNDVAAAFDAAAAPLGTYKLKYRRPMVALNGMLGLYGGFEYLNSDGVKGTAPMVAPFAPIGLHGSFPINDSWHVGVLISVLDVGALATYRGGKAPEGDLAGADPKSTPDVKQTPQVGFAQVFSPGAYLLFGLGGSPFVAGAGLALSPELREVTQEGGFKTDASVLRVGAFLGVDVPIFPLN